MYTSISQHPCALDCGGGGRAGSRMQSNPNSLMWPQNPSFPSSKADAGIRGVEGGFGESSGLGTQQTPVLALWLYSREP